uniref:Protein Wnt n=2 Tax=Sycon ciliatum TaxID=27933 RepID=A0A077SMU8_9METZ|nr:Wnt O SciWntO [Sycon ciliatum]
MAVQECRTRFAQRQWNCVVKPRSMLRNALRQGSPEAGFVAASQMAGVAYSLLEACKREQFAGGYCGGNATTLSDRARGAAGSAAARWGQLQHTLQTLRVYMLLDDEAENDLAKARRLNSDIGLQVVLNMMSEYCGCRPSPGATCSLTCLGSTLSFSRVSKTIMSLYYSSVLLETNSSTDGTSQENTTNISLVHLQTPDYCQESHALGSPGTRGRRCEMRTIAQEVVNETGPHQDGACQYLCCGRGQRFETFRSPYKCLCSWSIAGFKCQTCHATRRLYFCL